MPAILAIDDEQDMLALLKRIISDKTSYHVGTLDDPLKLTDLLRVNTYDVVLTDLKMPGKSGIEVLEEVKRKSPQTAVVIMTAYGTIDSALDATRKGAFDYVTKPFRKERILRVIEQALSWQSLQQENKLLREELEAKTYFPTLIGTSQPMLAMQKQIEKVARTSATVLITGESGTGKELVARALHANSARSNRQFIPIDCSTIPESIIESELFGHAKGSFTGALRDKKGLVEEADGGTLFLDEIGDLNPAMQVKLLRLLQEGEFKVVGSNAIRKTDIRFIAATNQDLAAKISRGEFREDLFYRLNVINMQVPPLRERREDIPLLVTHFLDKYNSLHHKQIKKMSPDAMQYMLAGAWHGNVRELENLVERGVIMASGEILEIGDFGILSEPPGNTRLPNLGGREADDLFAMPFKEAKDIVLEQFQTEYIAKALTRNEGNVSQAARESGLKRQYLHRLMRETNLSSRTFKKNPSD
ncbi:MAG: sigma-54 dependent transcriptional regulator [Desulfobacteraceae bacterium]|nr:sigma-54 dependent transcriptional regulator [Desulfobacteraceae bacterium]